MSGDTTAAPQALPKVLIVDDSRMVRASLIKHIRGRFQFREEADGEAGWQALVIDPSIELVLTDIGMPHLDGYGLLARIRESKLARLQQIPVVIISGDEDDEARERARELGANDFITKGISSTELLARLDSLWRLAQTRRELEESRAALAQQSSVETISSLNTDTYLNWHGAQDMAVANRHQGGISAMVIEIDHYAELTEWHGANVAQLVARKLSKILTNKIRDDDTVAQLAPGQFAVLSPSADGAACCAFALRLQKAIGKLVMTYREERIRISISVGIASSSVDGMKTVSHLVGVAVQRMQSSKRSGGNRVMSDQGEVTQETVDRLLRQSISIDQVLLRLRMGDTTAVGERLPDVISALLPLLDAMEAQLHCGLPLESLRAYKSAGSDDGSH